MLSLTVRFRLRRTRIIYTSSSRRPATVARDGWASRPYLRAGNGGKRAACPTILVGGQSELFWDRNSAAQRRNRNMKADPIHSQNPRFQAGEVTMAWWVGPEYFR